MEEAAEQENIERNSVVKVEAVGGTQQEQEQRKLEAEETPPPIVRLYYAVSSAWVNAWLAFAFASKTSPDPGPCNNDMLLFKDTDNKCYIPEEGMKLTRKGRKGDYRHVTEGMWKQICISYPGSGPAIRVNFVEVCGALYF